MRKKGRKTEWTELGDDDIYRRGWLDGFDRERRRMQEQKEEEELKKRVRRESERGRMVRGVRGWMEQREEEGMEFRIRQLKRQIEEQVSGVSGASE